MSFKHVTDEILSGYLAGELTAREKYDADSHFTICPECAAKLENQRSFEKKIAAAYNSSFPLYLSPDAHCAVAEEISAGFAVDTKAPVWQKRIFIKFFTQAASVMFVAALIAVMILTQSNTAIPQEAVPAAAALDQAPAAPAAPKVNQVIAVKKKLPVAVNKVTAVVKVKKQKTVVKPDVVKPVVQQKAIAAQKSVAAPKPVVPADVQVAKIAKPAPAAIPEKVKAKAVVKKTPVGNPLLQSNPALIRYFHIHPVAVRKTSDNIFLLQGVKSPFANDLYVIYAASGTPEKGAQRKVELSLSAAGKIPFAVYHPAGQSDVCIMSILTPVLPREIGKLESVISEGPEKQTNTLLLGKEIITADFNTAPEQVRLAAVLYAAAVPRLILKRDVRTKVLAELEKLLAGGYAGDPKVRTVYEQLKKVR